ncbi:MAG: nitroreductase family deazaflavin-dependent oxidoreductase [Anaerolineales bacterium]|nr:nitroreductase family deazaflavin-dependent oxidoreductase [Anaerolineales bacterium]
MNARPNACQRFIHRFLMLKPVSAFLARVLHHLDAFVLRLTRGKCAITQIVGLPIIRLTSIGAQTGQARTLPLVSLIDGEKIAVIGTNFGQKHNPSWYYNLRAHPECEVHFSGCTAKYIAREAEGDEREKYWQLAVSYYKGYDVYKIRAAHRKIPVMILESV